MLEVKGIDTYYGNIQALRDVSLRVDDGEIVTLIGANGAGKSTTLMTICGINRPRKGEILWNGEPIHELPPHEIVRLGISQVPEGRLIFPDLSVRDVVFSFSNEPNPEAFERIRDILLTTSYTKKAG